ncbi:tail fiber domain-containing protein [Enterobacter cloacae complex sp. 363J6]|uniref:tail fiber domain-containing protein n=1 Tax=Enterobacter cloacae complex sp. 363J6 TaxID=3395868 RepID=UPI003CEE3DEF
MADLKLGTTLGGAGIWSASNLPLLPSGDRLLFKGWRVYTENDRPTAEDINALSMINGGVVAKNTTFNQNLVVGASLTANLIQSNSVLTIQRSANPAEMIFYRPDITTTPSSEAWVLNMYAKDGLNRNMGSLIISARTDGGNKVYLRANKDGSPNTSLTLDSQTQQVTVEQGSFRVIGTTNLGVTNAASMAVSGAVTANTVTPTNWANHDERYITGIPRGMQGNSFGAAVVTEKNDVLSVGGNITDGPYGNTTYYGQVVNYRRSLNTGVSLVQTYFGNEMWFRLGTGSPGAWSWNQGDANGWRRVYDTVSPPTPAEVGAVNKAGDTMTGGLALLGDLTFRNLVNRHIRFEYTKNDGSTAVDAYIYKDGVDSSTRRSGLRINCATPNKASGNTSNSGDFVFGENGTFTLPGGGMIVQDGLNQGVYCMSALSTTASGSKNYLRKFRGGNADTIWHETVQGGVWRLATGSTDAQEELQVSTAGYCRTRQEFQSTAVKGDGGQFRAVAGNYGFIIRNDGGSTYFLLTNSGDPYGGWSSLRPITISNSNGVVSIANGANINGSVSFGNAVNFNGTVETNGVGCGTPNGLGTTGISLGDNDTGFKQEGDGILNAYANSQRIMRWTTGATANYKQLQVQGVNGAALLLNNTASNQSVYMLLQYAGTNAGYVGFGGSDSTMTMHNYQLNTNLQLRTSDLYMNRGLYVEGNVNANDVYIRSDIRLKSNLVELKDSLSKIEQLKGYIYDKQSKDADDIVYHRESGLIAQDVEKVLPEAVREDIDTGMLTISPSGINALLVNAINELRERLEAIENKLGA